MHSILCLYFFAWHFKLVPDNPPHDGDGVFFTKAGPVPDLVRSNQRAVIRPADICILGAHAAAPWIGVCPPLPPPARGLILRHNFSSSDAVGNVRVLADDVSSAAFGPLNAVWLSSWVVSIITGGSIHGSFYSKARWLEIALQGCSPVIAWLDIYVAKLAFRRKSLNFMVAFVLTYFVWLQWWTLQSKIYPYPHLNAVPYPEGILLAAGCMQGACLLFFYAGQRIRVQQGPVGLKKFKHR
eukprot:SM000164S02277  [mRNA]  locus=s164:269375:271329:- [translate_table: standard]